MLEKQSAVSNREFIAENNWSTGTEAHPKPWLISQAASQSLYLLTDGQTNTSKARYVQKQL